MKIHVLQHVPYEGPGYLATWAQERRHKLALTRLYAGDRLPRLHADDWLVSLGGPMSVHDEQAHPWLAAEKRLLVNAIGSGNRVLGICLGAQMIAHVLGARVYPNEHKEIGWFPVRKTAPADRWLDPEIWPEGLVVFHWHGETFDLPPGARHLLRSRACEHQAFVYGSNVVALQFHVEMTPQGVRDLAEHARDELAPGPFVQEAGALMASPPVFRKANVALAHLLDRMAGAGSPHDETHG